VAVLSTGDELLEIDEPWEDGKIINSNSYSIAAQVLECGAKPLQLGIARDRREDLAARMKEGLVADILITTGGVSVGDYDLVKGLLKDLGQMSFWKVAMRPGQPLAFGAWPANRFSDFREIRSPVWFLLNNSSVPPFLKWADLPVFFDRA